MRITLLLFATLREIIGERRLTLELEPGVDNVGKLRDEMIMRYPAADDNLRVALAAVNEEFAFDADAIHDGDEVAFFPPSAAALASGPSSSACRTRISITTKSSPRLRRPPLARSASSAALCAARQPATVTCHGRNRWNMKPTSRWR